ncbi:MAG TPA: 6-phosphofructokinase [Syntrophomonadaceae bacterium]|nr:6-phosphofructokinase [Syntrophomonadaceae bacterium]
MNRLAVLTSGGDASGMNAAIRAVVRSALYKDIEVYGVTQGLQGLIEGNFKKMSLGSVADIIHRGGTILQTSRSNIFMTEEGQRTALTNLQNIGIDNLVIIGGNGSLNGGYSFSKLGINVICIPATIDNDIVYTKSIGFDTAVNTVLEAINRIRDTATSHGRVFIIEVMGHNCGELALAAGVAGGAESILIPEIEPDIDEVVNKIKQGTDRGKLHSIIIVAEGVYLTTKLKDIIKQRTRQEVRITNLGHVQRGGTPTACDRILASYFGKAAVDYVADGIRNIMVASYEDKIHAIPLAEVIHGHRTLKLEMLEIARVLSI